MNRNIKNNLKTIESSFVDKPFTGVLFMLIVCLLCGCGEFFQHKPTELESQGILEELRQVKENPNLENPLPEIYLKPPSRINIAGDVKLFYFTRHHPAKDLAALVNQQLGFNVVPTTATNQLVIYCPDDAQADMALEYLKMIDVPPIQVNIDCLILERFGDVTMDWETSIMIENFLGEGITFGEKRGTFTPVAVGTVPKGSLSSLEAAFPGARLREGERATFGLDFGYWIDKNVPGHQVRTIVDILESRGYLKILLNPTLETVNGKKATVTIRDWSSFQKIVTGYGEDSAFNITDYMWVEDTLSVTPYVFADGFIGLKTDIIIGSRSKPEGVTQAAIITQRSINVEENRIEPGQSLIIGGIRKSEKRSVVRGIPFFKDIPVLGVLFSSKDFEEKGTEIIYILTPSISSGGQDYATVISDIKKKHAGVKYKPGLTEMFTDPLTSGIYTELIEQDAAKTEVEKAKAEAARAEAQRIAQAAKDKTAKAQATADAAEAEADAAMLESIKAKTDADAAQKQLQAEKAKAAQTQTEKDKLATEAAAAKAKAQKTVKEAQAAKVAAEKAAAQAAAAKAEAQKAKTQAQAAKKAAEQKAKAQAAKEAAENTQPDNPPKPPPESTPPADEHPQNPLSSAIICNRPENSIAAVVVRTPNITLIIDYNFAVVVIEVLPDAVQNKITVCSFINQRPAAVWIARHLFQKTRFNQLVQIFRIFTLFQIPPMQRQYCYRRIIFGFRLVHCFDPSPHDRCSPAKKRIPVFRQAHTEIQTTTTADMALIRTHLHIFTHIIIQFVGLGHGFIPPGMYHARPYTNQCVKDTALRSTFNKTGKFPIQPIRA